MGFSADTSIPILTVFLQGLISFFSPCILPLVPLYISYLSGGAKTVSSDGIIQYPRKQVMMNTVFFAIGISFAFFVLGLGVTSLGQFFSNNRLMFAKISGIIMIFFGLYQFGFFGRSQALEKEHRMPFRLDRWAMGPLPALFLGFTFSFAWTPCVGPILGSVLLMAATGSSAAGFALIGVFTVGFVLPFLAVGFFTQSLLSFFKEHQSVVRYSVKIGATLMIVMGIMTFTGTMNGFTNYLSNNGTAATAEGSTSKTTPEAPTVILAPDFQLMDQFGNIHTLSEYKGKTIFLNFWATWCPPCRGEMPHIQEIYEEYGLNEKDVVILGVAAPKLGREGSKEDVISFLEDNDYTFPVLMDENHDVFQQYAISAFPTTFMVDANGAIYGYVVSALEKDMMLSIVEQTKESVSGDTESK
ncbi:thiol-disulfide oxidoreductase ResA [Anaerotignum neopropionicum]|uniref:Thiol-disulfide oxidoreductase ResA n=1 Tax=Anaerotignum neopropionicum TaxID=36847 RepID=A0A136WBJ7_9FIRM|nr:cytochrome c biogenesis protein/redoxin [Anaerotignum neopropionicum]KXL51897.1 thiol-disulfide oxidoreductase ResA [Anaerotignum neopropionicum]